MTVDTEIVSQLKVIEPLSALSEGGIVTGFVIVLVIASYLYSH